MAEEVDYGYGDVQPDYGYGDTAPDQPKPNSMPEADFGYGEASPSMDYGYGDTQPASTIADYGYGDTMEYGYGDGGPAAADSNTMDYGYGDGAPAQLPPDRRPKRRCSVTKYTLENEDKESPLTAHTRINDFRKGAVDAADGDTSRKSTPTTSEESLDKSGEEGEPNNTKGKKKSMMHRIRKRLSIVTLVRATRPQSHIAPPELCPQRTYSSSRRYIVF